MEEKNKNLKVEVLRNHLITVLTGEQAHINFEGALAELKKENRSVRPSEKVHSIWELVEHIRITQNDILNYINDPGWISPKWPDKHWPENKSQISDDDWQNSVNNFFSDQKQLINLIKNSKIDLREIIPHTKSHTYLREILLIADHNAYHIGQVITVRKLLNDWNY